MHLASLVENTMKNTALFLLLAGLPLGVFAQAQDAAAPAAAPETIPQPYEAPGFIKTADFLPANLMQGDLHTVDPRCYSDGLRNTYYITSMGRTIEVTGTPQAAERIKEIYALDYLRNQSKSEEFAKAMVAAGRQKLDSVENLVRDPVGTLKGVPKGASKFFGRIGEGLKGNQENTDSNALESITGVSKAKAQLAAQLGISPYTTNEVLQQELTAVARAMAGGGLIVSAASAAVGGGAGAALSAIGVNETLQQTLINSTPSDLRIVNRKKLLALGASEELANEFLDHALYSPVSQTVTVDSLSKIGANPTTFLRGCLQATSHDDAFYFQRLSVILANYHANVARLKSIRVVNGLIAAHDSAGILVVPVSLDYAIWTSKASARTAQFSALALTDKSVKGVALWTDGRISKRFTEELSKLKVPFQMDCLTNPVR